MGLIADFLTEMENIGVECVRQVAQANGTLLLLQGRANKRRASVVLTRGILSTADEQKALQEAVASVKAQLSQKSGDWPEIEPTE